MALAWKAGWVNALRGSNPLSSATTENAGPALPGPAFRVPGPLHELPGLGAAGDHEGDGLVGVVAVEQHRDDRGPPVQGRPPVVGARAEGVAPTVAGDRLLGVGVHAALVDGDL